METVRRDGCEITVQTMKKIFDCLMLHKDIPGAYKAVEDALQTMKEGNVGYYPFIIWKKLSKPISSYKEPLPGHVRVAQKQKSKTGVPVQVGDRIPMVITMPAGGGGKKTDEVTKHAMDPMEALEQGVRLNISYYITKHVLEPCCRLLKFVCPEDVKKLYASVQDISDNVATFGSKKIVFGSLESFGWKSSAFCIICGQRTNNNWKYCDTCTKKHKQEIWNTHKAKLETFQAKNEECWEICAKCKKISPEFYSTKEEFMKELKVCAQNSCKNWYDRHIAERNFTQEKSQLKDIEDLIRTPSIH